MDHHQFEIPGAEGVPLRGDIRLPGDGGRSPVLIFCHGFKGFKDWGCWPYVAERLAGSGFAVITFNFSHGGIGADPYVFSELDLFRHNTFSLELEDFRLLLTSLLSGELPGNAKMETSRIGVFGHSRGGATALRGAAAEARYIGAVATLASISKIYRRNAGLEADWRTAGVRHVRNMRTGQELPLGVELLEDMIANADAIEHAAKSLSVPVLILHGDADEAVSASSADDLSSWMPQARKVILPGATHTFGAVHPFAGWSADLATVVEVLAEFFRGALLSGTTP